MSNLDIIRGRQAVIPLTNKSGGSVVAGDLVVVDSSTDESFTTSSTINAEVSIGIAQESIANNASGRVLVYGYAPLVTTALISQTRGNYMFHSSNTKTARGQATRANGAVGQFLKTSTTPSAWLWGNADPTPAGGGVELLAYKEHTAGDETTTSTSLADLDATNAVVTFTAPSSGNVLIRLTAVVAPPQTAGGYVSWGLRESTTDIEGAVGESIAARAAAATTVEYRSASMVWVRTGLTPSSSYTYKWSWATSTGTGNQKANASAPSVMEVWSV